MQGEKLAINAIDNITETIQIPLTIAVQKTGNYRLHISEMYGLEEEFDLFIEDTFLQTFQSFSMQDNIEIYAKENTEIAGRFILHFVPKSSNEDLTKEAINIFPNPAHDFVNLQLSNAIKGHFEVEIYGMNGRKIRQFSFTKSDSFFQKKLNISDLKKGTYLLKIVNEEEQLIRKIIKQ